MAREERWLPGERAEPARVGEGFSHHLSAPIWLRASSSFSRRLRSAEMWGGGEGGAGGSDKENLGEIHFQEGAGLLSPLVAFFVLFFLVEVSTTIRESVDAAR